jgi:hypothetical protein
MQLAIEESRYQRFHSGLHGGVRWRATGSRPLSTTSNLNHYQTIEPATAGSYLLAVEV